VFDPLFTAEYNFVLILGIFFVIWMNDTMAYVVGKYFGRHKLIRQISPKKTWEGTLAGFLFAILTSVGISQFTPVIDTLHSFVLGGIISIAANLGDLFESSLKRSAGQKDSGKLLPGHGGVLDRFDAAIFAIPFAFLYLHLVML
jgi:phosphatidate cytidylyltransferase